MEIARLYRSNNDGSDNVGFAALVPDGLSDKELFNLLPSDHGVLGTEFVQRQAAREDASFYPRGELSTYFVSEREAKEFVRELLKAGWVENSPGQIISDSRDGFYVCGMLAKLAH